MRMDVQSEMQAELEKAVSARSRGNEGQARVCARRAAGIVARAYFSRLGEQIRTPSAFDVLQLVVQDLRLPDTLRQMAAHLTLRVDEEFKLPPGVDLIVEARELCEGLLRQMDG